MRRSIIDKRYRILKKLGTGATGNVYAVRDLKDNRIIALKILSKEKTSSEAVQRFKREFKLLAGLRHPNLCSVYNFGMLKDGRSYFTMEYVDGEDIFEAAKRLPYKKIYPWVVELCRVLEYIHSRGLIHYDVKPDNVLIAKGKKHYAQNPMFYAKLLDFGLASEQRIKGGILIRGTMPYIAPEVVKGLAIDHRADLFSLGVLLYEIFTRRKFQIKDKESFVTFLKQQEKIVSELPSNIVPDIPKRLERLIIRLLEFEPAARFNRANEVIKEINKISGKKFESETEKTLEGYLLSSEFVGREKEMGVLQSLYEKARHGEGKVVLMTGDAGIGKTRLLKEFRIFTQLRRSHSYIGYTHKDKTLRPIS
jgi:serine/threonine protein kinase